MTQERIRTFTPENKKGGDVIRAQDWNDAMDEIARLNAAKLNSAGDNTIAGSLTVQGNLSVPSGNLSLGANRPIKKLQIEDGELRIQASHNTVTPDIATFLSKDQKQGLGIGANLIAAVGDATNQDINLVPKGNGALSVAGSLKLAKGPAVNELSIDGTFTDNSDSILPTQRAVKTYVETRLSSFEKTDFKTQNLSVAGKLGIGTTNPSEKLEVNGNIKLSGTIVQEVWQEAKLINGWKNDEAITWDVPGYFKDSISIVHLRGVVLGGSGVIFILPEGYRPPKRQMLTTTSNHAWGRLDISPDGSVILNNGSNWVTLYGITFRAEK